MTHPTFDNQDLFDLFCKRSLAYRNFWNDLEQVEVFEYETPDHFGIQVYSDIDSRLEYMHEEDPYNAWVLIWSRDKKSIIAETHIFHTHMNGYTKLEKDVVTDEPLRDALKEGKKLLAELRA